MISPSKIIEANILSSSDSMVHSEFYYPVQGGSQFIVNRLSEGIPISHEQVQSVDLVSDTYLINHNQHSGYDHLVFTGDLRLLPDIFSPSVLKAASITNEETSAIRCLRSHGTTTLLCECDINPYSWIYLPDATTKLHRMIMTGNFSATNTSQSISLGRTTCTVEYSGWMSELDMKRELSKLPFNPVPIAYHHCPSSYVVHDHHTSNLVSGFVGKLRSVRIYCCGRFSEWQYYNMDAAIVSAMNVTQLLIEAS
jgi:protoporphyrinogen oxidase